jgi:hypothetical protein
MVTTLNKTRGAEMTKDQNETVRTLRDAGYLVIIWAPDELCDVDTRHIEDVLIERGNDMIEQLKGE